MNRLALRTLSPLQAKASRALGAGMHTSFQARGLPGELCLTPLSPDAPDMPGTWVASAIGPLRLSDAGAVLSLLGELPVSVEGEPQAWYWEALSQHLSPVIAAHLSPLAMLQPAPPAAAEIRCAIRVQLGEEVVRAQLGSSASTLLDWLQAPIWRPRQRPLPTSLGIREPLILGLCELSYEQLTSLRPGDVVLPCEERFDCEGRGLVTLAQRSWVAQTQACGTRLLLNLQGDADEHERH